MGPHLYLYSSNCNIDSAIIDLLVNKISKLKKGSNHVRNNKPKT